MRCLSAKALMDRLQNGTDADRRGQVFQLPRDSIRQDRQALFPHQEDCLNAFERNNRSSGIIHLPTGAGKTRVAIEIMARLLHDNPAERIIWATYPLVLVRQAMVRLVELAHLFPEKTKFQWADPIGARDLSSAADVGLLSAANITYMTREDLRYLLERAADKRRSNAALHDILGDVSKPFAGVTVIYDECHQLGAEGLQRAWKKFSKRTDIYGKVRVVGLSATPMPTAQNRQNMLGEIIFPVGKFESAKPEWPVLVHASVDSSKLVADEILCEVNMFFQNTKIFDLADSVLMSAGIDEFSREYGASERVPRNQLGRFLTNFAEQFEGRILSHDSVLKFFSDRLAENLPKLGKTLVFVPTINAANRLARFLGRDKRIEKGNVTVVHSRLNEFAEKDLEDASVSATDAQAQIEAFRRRGDTPCIMINVGMLTTGFDDPKIRTVVLARLVFSSNLFWQMIGRGLRGLKCGGTKDCNVIDPVRLTDRFRWLEGYQPKIGVRPGGFILGAEDQSDQSADTHVPLVNHAPIRCGIVPEISDSMRSELRAALEAFLRGSPIKPEFLREIDLIAVNQGGSLALHYVQVDPEKRSNESGIGSLYADRVNRLQAELTADLKTQVDLSWLDSVTYRPSSSDLIHQNLALNRLELVRTRKLITPDALVKAEADILAAAIQDARHSR